MTTETNARTDSTALWPKRLKIECACGYRFAVAADGWTALLCPQCKTEIQRRIRFGVDRWATLRVRVIDPMTTETNTRRIECACGYTFVVADGWSALLCPQCKTLTTSASALARMFPPPETTESKG